MHKNIFSVYFDQIYLLAAGLFFVPFFIKYLGVACYGLFGLFAVAQGIFQLLDAGLAPTLTRQATRYVAGVSNAKTFRHEFFLGEVVFVSVSSIGLLVLLTWTLLSNRPWVSSQDINLNVVKLSLVFIFLTVAIRFICSLYKGVLRGFESHIVIGWIGIASTTCRFILAIPLIIYSSGSPIPFFALQALISLLELSICRWLVRLNMPAVKIDLSQIPEVFRGLWRFSGAISILSLAWIFLTVIDRLILSRTITLEEYGIYTLGITIAGVTNGLTSPIGTVMGPRLATLVGEGKLTDALCLYKKYTYLITLLAGAICSSLFFFAAEIVWVWVGDRAVGEAAKQVVMFYGIGYFFVAVSTCAYQLQFARGRLRLNVVGAIIQSALLPVVIYLGVSSYGLAGVAKAWCAIQIVYFVFWIPVIHRDVSPDFHFKWIFKDFAPRILIPFLWCGFTFALTPHTNNRWLELAFIIINVSSLFVPLLVLMPQVRSYLRLYFIGTRV